MHVALDATPLTVSTGGLPRYVTQLSLALAEQFPEHRYSLYSDQPFSFPQEYRANLTAAQGPRSGLERFWWLWGLPRRLRADRMDVFHGTNFEVPYAGRTPSAMTILDLSPWKDRAWHAGAQRVRRRTPWLLKSKKVQVITLSNALRSEVIEFFQLDPDRVHAVPLAAPETFGPKHIQPLHPRPFFLFAGTIEPRKNVPALVEAWQKTRTQTGADLLLAGRVRSDGPRFSDAEGLFLLGEVTDEELTGYYSQALATVYPTLYEGFGLPVLEAMQCGCPVITSRDPAVMEVSGGTALHCNGVDELAAQMVRVGSDGNLRQRLRAAGIERAKAFSWKSTAIGTQEIYREMLAR